MVKKWALILHFYQPPVQDLSVTKQVLESAYMPVLRLLDENPRAKVTVNISACLVQQLNKLQKHDFFSYIKKLVAAGKVELLNGPAFHPILPLISEETLERQFNKTRWIFGDFLGSEPGRGIFAPELAITSDLLAKLKDQGDYVIADETSTEKGIKVVEKDGMRIYINDREICDILRAYPKQLSGKVLCDWVDKNRSGDLIITASDVEVFGHHYQERLESLRMMFNDERFEFVTLSELKDIKADGVKFEESSWQHVPSDKYKHGPFWLWNNGENPLQRQYWDLAGMAEKVYKDSDGKMEGYARNAAAEHLDMGLSSCYPYWISNWPWWHPDLVERGAQQLIKCVRSIEASREAKLEVEELYHNFLNDLWRFHWSGEVEKNFKEFEIERERLLSSLPELG